MAVTIQHKRSQTTGDTPTASDIAQGEIALNLADLRLFTKDHNNAIQRIGGEDVAATLDFTKADGTVGGISVTGFKMNFTKADGTATTYNIFQQMMLFSLFQGHFVSRSVFNTHQHTETQAVTFDNDTTPAGTTSVPI
tara:strand:- start:5406 stop:5819 length:414 start_codon:yes stop_codon:yes gene_type:complete